MTLISERCIRKEACTSASNMKWTACKRILILLLTFMISQQDFAQVKILRAKIIDVHSEEPVPFASVQFYKTKFAKLSDSAGNFRFVLEKWPSDSLWISYAGFEDSYLHLDTSRSEISLIIKMERKKNVKEVVVKPKFEQGSLDALSKTELVDLARKKGIKISPRMGKAAIIKKMMS